tara:strand:- start:217 stop:435 length:219 start_codon:yes stop_codon:yes gene_type:complete
MENIMDTNLYTDYDSKPIALTLNGKKVKAKLIRSVLLNFHEFIFPSNHIVKISWEDNDDKFNNYLFYVGLNG